ncbi:MAG: hypothetical protein Q4G05_06905 [Clostridia bacterium]|nr:hypothetical protein [Clostridia bacterium]
MELKPIGKTLENFFNSGLLEKDIIKAEDYVIVKNLIDKYHKYFLEKTLSDIELDWEPLYEELLKFRKENNKSERDRIKSLMLLYRKHITERFEKEPEYKDLIASTPKNLFENILSDFDGNNKVIETFSKFFSYFIGFQENRKNIYSNEDKSTAASCRSVNDNFPKFINNIAVYNLIKKNYPELLELRIKEIQNYMPNYNLNECFTVNYYNKVLSQKGIDNYNLIVQGKSVENGPKFRGVNEVINNYSQQNPEKDISLKRLRMSILFKQILNERDVYSYIPDKFESDQELLDSVKDYCDKLLYTSETENKRNISVLDE